MTPGGTGYDASILRIFPVKTKYNQRNGKDGSDIRFDQDWLHAAAVAGRDESALH